MVDLLQKTQPKIKKYPGHRNVLFKNFPKRIYNGVCEESDTPEKLKAVLEKEEPGNYVVISHFHCGDPTVKPGVDDCLEISGWCASFIRENNGLDNDIGGRTSVNEGRQLSSGFGIVCGTDHGSEAYYTGLRLKLLRLKGSTWIWKMSLIP